MPTPSGDATPLVDVGDIRREAVGGRRRLAPPLPTPALDPRSDSGHGPACDFEHFEEKYKHYKNKRDLTENPAKHEAASPHNAPKECHLQPDVILPTLRIILEGFGSKVVDEAGDSRRGNWSCNYDVIKSVYLQCTTLPPFILN
ncbi:hypothetical protein EVAR_54806_1 [Eumeta japonica]|uniref:Uncharacterized protein n=1 Tax=Eumeta variegata TaxID=151549 RepID=A0A4C1Y4C6_EUMVA|nr:hypothetical protein EVAR_54806_1 [Eumeta japonica]